MKLLIHKNEPLFSFLKELQLNLHRPNDFAYERAEMDVIDKRVNELPIPSLPPALLKDVDFKDAMDMYHILADQYYEKLEKIKNSKMPHEEVKQHIIDNYHLIKVIEWRFIGDGYFEVTGEYIK